MNRVEVKSYWEERLGARWGLESVGYLGLGRPYNQWLYRVQAQVFQRRVGRLPIPWDDTNVLDIGSGTGFYVRLWNSLGCKSVTATDLTMTSVSQLRTALPDTQCHQLDVGDVLPEKFQSRTYDVVSAFGVLYHIMDDAHYARAFQNIADLLRPGGTFVFSENFIRGDTVRGAHQVTRSAKRIQDLLKEVGFKIKSTAPMFVFMNTPVDSRAPGHRVAWRTISGSIKRVEPLGFAVGAALYPLELIAVSRLKRGPSTQLMICEKLP